MNKLRIGIIGLGGISEKHIAELKTARDGEITAICDIDEAKLNEKGEKLGIPGERRFTDYRDLIACSEVDAVEICTPNYLHVQMATEVINAGKPVNVEKPLSCTMEDVHNVTEALEKNPQPNMMCFSYRFCAAVRFAKHILEQGLIGEVTTVNIEYLKSSAFIPGRRLEWRFEKEKSGTGVLGDLGVHLIDMTRYLIGDIKAVCARKKIVIKERKKLNSEEYAPVTTDDCCMIIADIEGGATASFNITRCAHGHANTIKYDIFGTNGVISFNLNDPSVLGICIGEIDIKTCGVRTVKVPAEFYASQEQTFIDIALGRCKEAPADIYEGVACQKILDAVDEASASDRWVEIS